MAREARSIQELERRLSPPDFQGDFALVQGREHLDANVDAHKLVGSSSVEEIAPNLGKMDDGIQT